MNANTEKLLWWTTPTSAGALSALLRTIRNCGRQISSSLSRAGFALIALLPYKAVALNTLPIKPVAQPVLIEQIHNAIPFAG